MALRKNNINITNKQEVKDILRGLSDTVKKKVLRKAVTAALSPMVNEAKKNLTNQKRTGLLRKSINKKIKTYGSGVVLGLVGPSKEVIGELRGKKVWPNKYAHLVEYGTKPHYQQKANRFHKGSKGSGFLSKAWNSRKSEITDIMIREIELELNKIANKGSLK